MSTRARLQNANDSKSLWNYTLSPGWSEFDAHILRLAVMRYGCGAWRDINKHFPFKTCGQLNLQTQRLFGQQALAEFNKVHIDPLRIKEINDKIDGFRKNTCLINEGNNLKAEEREARRKKHIEKFGIPNEIYEQITVPVVLDPPLPCKTVVDDIEKLREMYRAVYDIQLRRQHLNENNSKNGANIAIKAKQERNQNKNKNNKNKKEQKFNDKNKEKVEEKMEVEEETNKDNDVEIIDKPKKPEPAPSAPANDINMMDMDEETAMALALSASMASTNINTPAVEKKAKSKHTSKRKKTKKSAKKSAKKSTKKSAKKSAKKSRKRKKMEADGDEEYIPGGAEPKKKRSRKK